MSTYQHIGFPDSRSTPTHHVPHRGPTIKWNIIAETHVLLGLQHQVNLGYIPELGIVDAPSGPPSSLKCSYSSSPSCPTFLWQRDTN
ncbi:hypothetical protein BDV29DRAFT_175994, partial [Aspergillus leporis]